mgnify:CR=1 FL=1
MQDSCVRLARKGETGESSRSEVRGFRNFEPRTSDRVFLACRTLERLADFFSILLEPYGDGGGNAWTTDDVVDWNQPPDRVSLSWGGRATAIEGRAGGFVGRGKWRA